MAQSAVAVEYTDCISAEGYDSLDECPGNDMKHSDGVEIWGMWSTPSLPLLSGPLCPGVEAPDRILSIDQIELFDYLNWVQTNDFCKIELLEI